MKEYKLSLTNKDGVVNNIWKILVTEDVNNFTDEHYDNCDFAIAKDELVYAKRSEMIDIGREVLLEICVEQGWRDEVDEIFTTC